MTYTKIRSILSRGSTILEEQLNQFDSEEAAFTREIELIAYYGRRFNNTGILTNHTTGAGGSLSANVINEETHAKMSAAKAGNKSSVGRKRPDITKKFSKPITAFTMDGEVASHYASSRDAAAALGMSYKTISNILVKEKGYATGTNNVKYHFRYGTIVDPINSLKYDYGNGKVIQLTISGVFVAEHTNANQASIATGIAPQSIRYCMSGKTKTAGNFCWQLKSVG